MFVCSASESAKVIICAVEQLATASGPLLHSSEPGSMSRRVCHCRSTELKGLAKTARPLEQAVDNLATKTTPQRVVRDGSAPLPPANARVEMDNCGSEHNCLFYVGVSGCFPSPARE